MLDFSRHRNIYTFLITLLFLIGIKFAISYTTTSSFFRISIDAEASSDRKFTVYYSANSHLSEKKSQESGLYLGGERDTQTLTISNNIAKKLRLDLGNSPGTVRIYSIKLTSFFFPELIFHPQDIARDFLPVKDITTVKATPDYVEIVAAGSDPYMQYKGNLQGNSFFLDYILPLVFTFCFYLFLSSFVPADFPAFADCVAGRASSSGAHFASLDGIRGIAALIVLMEHTGVMSGGIGTLGVHLFFSLSGFLIAIPFTKSPSRAVSYMYLKDYILRRLKRIIPMYYTMVTIVFLFNNKNPESIRHYLFLQGNGYFWTVPQEMFFYLYFPLIVIGFYLISLIKRELGLLYLLVLIGVFSYLGHEQILTLYGLGNLTPLRASIFLSGAFFSYLYAYIVEKEIMEKKKWFKVFCSIAGVAVFLVLFVVESRTIEALRFYGLQRTYGVAGFLAAFFIFTVACNSKSFLGRCMALPIFRAVGIVGFSFYLIHPYLILFCDDIADYFFAYDLQGVMRFIVGGVVTYLFATFTYSYIERPFMKKNAPAPLLQKESQGWR